MGDRDKMARFRILIVDDSEDIVASLGGLLRDEGYEVDSAPDGEEGVRKALGVDLVLLDFMLPGIDGLEVLRRIKAREADLPVVMMSGQGTVAAAVEAVQIGAYDFMEKPLSGENVLITVENALDRRRLEQENKVLRARLGEQSQMIGQSPQMKALQDQIARVAPTEGRVLICGESGTGKELVAEAIVRASARSGKPFVKVNCAAIPRDLIESELFGHERGAFTGATGMKKGKFELADGGTLFLDEIGDMALDTQAKALRALEAGEIERVGGSRVIPVDVRVIAATNKDLEEEIRQKRFREDLYWRLNVVPLFVAPLRERHGDVRVLTEHFVGMFCAGNGCRPKSVTPEAMRLLEEHEWPGNVRALKNIVERLIIMGGGEKISAEEAALALGGRGEPARPGDRSLQEAVQGYEKRLVLRELDLNQGNVSRTARNLGVDRANLQRKLRVWGIRGECAI
ncbi:MAG: sigma-54 dependent transcriptional regulator [Candidatus Latescibacterota bacterium]